MSLEPAMVARDLWDAASLAGPAPKVFEMHQVADGRYGCVRLHRPAGPEWVMGTVKDLVCHPSTEMLGVWTATSAPEGAQLLCVVGDETQRPVALVGRIGSEPQVLEAVGGVLYTSCLASLTPVPADDPLVLELAGLTNG